MRVVVLTWAPGAAAAPVGALVEAAGQLALLERAVLEGELVAALSLWGDDLHSV